MNPPCSRFLEHLPERDRYSSLLDLWFLRDLMLRSSRQALSTGGQKRNHTFQFSCVSPCITNRLPFPRVHRTPLPFFPSLGVKMNVLSAPRLRLAMTCAIGVNQTCFVYFHHEKQKLTLFWFVSLCLPIYTDPSPYLFNMTWLKPNASLL